MTQSAQGLRPARSFPEAVEVGIAEAVLEAGTELEDVGDDGFDPAARELNLVRLVALDWGRSGGLRKWKAAVEAEERFLRRGRTREVFLCIVDLVSE